MTPDAPPPEPTPQRDAGPADEVLPTGTELTVTWGREHVQPVQYNGMDIGPFAMTVKSKPGETAMDVGARAMAMLDQLAEANYQAKLPKFLERIRGASRGGRGRG